MAVSDNGGQAAGARGAGTLGGGPGSLGRRPPDERLSRCQPLHRSVELLAWRRWCTPQAVPVDGAAGSDSTASCPAPQNGHTYDQNGDRTCR